MATAVHEITEGDSTTLTTLAAAYYAVGRPGGHAEPRRLARVIAAIRAASGEGLAGVGDDDPLAPGVVAAIPTFRAIPRALLCDHPPLEAALMRAGFDHANKLLKRPLAAVTSTLGPFTKDRPYGAQDVRRAYALTSLLDLDGMDVRTAIYLHDHAKVHSVSALASQPAATLQHTLERMVESEHRPKLLASSGHAERWRASALALGRRRHSHRARSRPFQVPFASRHAAARAAHYEGVAGDAGRDSADRTLARRLGLLHRFQAQVIDGNFHALARRWDRAGAAHQTARRLFHRLAEELGVAARVDDDRGLGLEAAIDVAYRLLREMPPGEDAPLGAPALRSTFDDSSRPYRLERDSEADDARTVVLPAAAPGGAVVRVPLAAATFARDYRARFLHPQLAQNGRALRADAAAWTNPAAFTALTPMLYGGPVRAAIGTSYAAQGHLELANQFASPYFDLVAADGVVLAPWSTLSDYLHDLDLGTCSTDFVDPDGDGISVLLEEMRSVVLPLEGYCGMRLDAGDALYRQNRRDEASAIYADVLCAIENYWKATGQSTLASAAQSAFTAVSGAALSLARGNAAAGPFRALHQLTTLGMAETTGSTGLEDYVTVTTATPPLPARFPSSTVRDAGAGSRPPSLDSVVAVDLNGALAGGPLRFDDVSIYVDAGLIDAYYFDYLYAQAKFEAIAAGLNWFGFTDTFVPAWSFDYLFEVASDLAGKAVDAERQVFQMLQLFEAAEEKEFLAGQALEFAEAQLAVADARVAQAEASAVLASQQALLTATQAEAAVTQSAFRAGVDFDNAEVQSALVADPVTGELLPAEDLFSSPYDLTTTYESNAGGTFVNQLLGSALSAVPIIGAFGAFPATQASRDTARNEYVTNLGVLQQAVAVAQATEEVNAAACATAAAERDAAMVSVNQAQEYLSFLDDQTLDSEGLEQLVALTSEVHDIYYYQAHRMAWLAQRAASYESRRTFEFVGWGYDTGDAIRDLVRSDFLRADLDTLRAEFTAGQTQRLQEVRWTLPLSQLDPGALAHLRATGQCVFVLRQDRVDREFPGTFLHRLKDLQLTFVGLLPPGGARGVLSMSGISWVRVPNTGAYLAGEIKSDWIADALAATAPYEAYVMKRLDGTPADISLSEFAGATDRAVLAVPRGMLRPLENLGLDTAWSLALPPYANRVPFENIHDVELTFWVQCAYDQHLQAAHAAALDTLGRGGQLTSAARLSALATAGDQLAALRGPVATPAQVDTRFLSWRLLGLPQDEQERRVTNLGLVAARRAGTSDELTLRLLSPAAPAGVRLTTNDGAAMTWTHVDTSIDPDAPPENAALADWMNAAFYDHRSKTPTEDPQQPWVVKVCAEHAGAAWEARDEDGEPVLSPTGPLVAGAGSIAHYSGGAAWTNCLLTVNARTGGGRVALAVRYLPDGGGTGYVLTIGAEARHNVRLSRRVLGVDMELARATVPYPADEFLAVAVRVFGDAATTTIGVQIDRIELFEVVDSAAPLAAGTVALRVDRAPAEPPGFDDLRVARLTRQGAVREMLLSESFDVLPASWVFSDGTTPWAISSVRHKRLDLARLLNVVLTVDYRYQRRAVPARTA